MKWSILMISAMLMWRFSLVIMVWFTTSLFMRSNFMSSVFLSFLPVHLLDQYLYILLVTVLLWRHCNTAPATSLFHRLGRVLTTLVSGIGEWYKCRRTIPFVASYFASLHHDLFKNLSSSNVKYTTYLICLPFLYHVINMTTQYLYNCGC